MFNRLYTYIKQKQICLLNFFKKVKGGGGIEDITYITEIGPFSNRPLLKFERMNTTYMNEHCSECTSVLYSVELLLVLLVLYSQYSTVVYYYCTVRCVVH